jgi:ketosteroid isomerase-like protein
MPKQKLTMKSLFLVMATGLVLASCSDSKSNEKTTAESTVATPTVSSKDLNQNFDQAWNKHDSTKLFSLLADDVQMLSGKVHFSGKTEVMDKFIRRNLPFTSNLQTTVVSTGEDNGIAYESGTFSLDVAPPDTKPFVNKGNYNFVWKKGADDSWKVSSINMEDLPVETK